MVVQPTRKATTAFIERHRYDLANYVIAPGQEGAPILQRTADGGVQLVLTCVLDDGLLQELK